MGSVLSESKEVEAAPVFDLAKGVDTLEKWYDVIKTVRNYDGFSLLEKDYILIKMCLEITDVHSLPNSFDYFHVLRLSRLYPERFVMKSGSYGVWCGSMSEEDRDYVKKILSGEGDETCETLVKEFGLPYEDLI